MKTRIQWLQEILNAEEYELAQDNVIVNPDDFCIKEISLISSFIFSKSKEGLDYWYNIHYEKFT